MKKFIGGPLPVPLTPAVLSPPLLFVSGQVPTEIDGSIPAGIEAQTDLVLRKIKGLVEEAGYTMADIVKTTVFMRDISQFESMNGSTSPATSPLVRQSGRRSPLPPTLK